MACIPPGAALAALPAGHESDTEGGHKLAPSQTAIIVHRLSAEKIGKTKS